MAEEVSFSVSCPGCGLKFVRVPIRLAGTSTVCSKCKASVVLVKTVTPTLKTCPTCKRQLAKNARTCPRCAHDFTWDKTEEQEKALKWFIFYSSMNGLNYFTGYSYQLGAQARDGTAWDKIRFLLSILVYIVFAVAAVENLSIYLGWRNPRKDKKEEKDFEDDDDFEDDEPHSRV